MSSEPNTPLSATRQNGEGKKMPVRKAIIVVCVLAALLTLLTAYFFITSSRLDGLVTEHNFLAAQQTAKVMPWLKLFNGTLLTYIDANAQIQQGNVAEGLALLKPLGGFLDSDEIYKTTATIDMIQSYALSENPDELYAALVNLPKYNTDGQYDTLRDSLYAQAYSVALDITATDPIEAKKLLAALPQDYMDTARCLELALLIEKFNSESYNAVYQETFEALRPYADTEPAAELFLSDNFISMFLNGTWETADGSDNFIQTTNFATGNGTHKTTLPVGEKNIQAKYENSSMYVLKQGGTDFVLMYTFTYIDYNTIEIFDAYNNITYTMYRKE